MHEELFPSGMPQERIENFSFVYVDKGQDFISFLMETMDPLSKEFTLIEI